MKREMVDVVGNNTGTGYINTWTINTDIVKEIEVSRNIYSSCLSAKSLS